MSVNWVLMSADGKDIVPLENETIFLREQGVHLELDCSNGGYPGAGVNYASKSGKLMLTNQRIVYLCDSPTQFFSSASLPVNNVQDSKLTQSWFSFSPPVFKAIVMPIPGGGLTQPARLSITFTTGKLDGAAPQHLEQLPVYVPPSSTTEAIITSGPSATTSAPMPEPLPQAIYHPTIPHTQPPPPPSEAAAAAAAAAPGLNETSSIPPPPPPQPVHQPPPPPHPYSTSQPLAQDIPSDLPPSYDEIH
ncbi:hypothetical protein BGZ65_003010 [Modicella reniformis]|uniref:Uncharacterized protein n=1 Tax=Modicella reniformis TaxID=1440133 RepID=A0A9P6MBF6_9FUNG|nr:hypothetical protein BGZ65_003010 [Modicella reniformis]